MRVEVIVNANARRGGNETARRLERALPFAHVRRTFSLEDVERLAHDVVASPPDLLLSAGGDGSALALLNALRRARDASDATSQPMRASSHALSPKDQLAAHLPKLRLGLLRLGTGNGWARSVGAPRLGRGLARLAEFARLGEAAAELPCSRFDLVEVEGLLTHFAGTGWDAELIDDFHTQQEGPSMLPRSWRTGLVGYLNGLFTRTVPRSLRMGRVEIEVKNTGAPALGIDAKGRPFEIEGGSTGSVLYRGPVSICAVGTSTEWGFGFRALPFARRTPGRFSLRMYVGGTKEALGKIPQLWSGRHPLPQMLNWMLSRCRVSFSRPVALQAGGDQLGHRDEIDYVVADEGVDVLDWRALGRLLGAPERRFKDAVHETIAPALLRQGILED